VQNARHTRTPQDLAAPWLGLLGPPLSLARSSNGQRSKSKAQRSQRLPSNGFATASIRPRPKAIGIKWSQAEATLKLGGVRESRPLRTP
jgi:hypothetical protein